MAAPQRHGRLGLVSTPLRVTAVCSGNICRSPIAEVVLRDAVERAGLGHAVLVDRWGVPRAKCSCGNPLSPPVPLTTPPVYVGPRWPTFDPTVIIVIIATDPVDEGFILVDLTTGEVRPVFALPRRTVSVFCCRLRCCRAISPLFPAHSIRAM